MARFPDPIITKTSIIFDLHEPIYADYYGIWDKWLKIAKRKNLNIILKTQFGISTYTYDTYMRGAVRGKHTHFYIDDPMIFYHRHVLKDIKERDRRKRVEKKIEMSSNSLFNGLLKLRKSDPKFYSELRTKLGLKHDY